MKTIVYTVVLFLGIIAAISPTLAQTPPPPEPEELTLKQWIDQLNGRLAKATSDTTRVKLLWKKGRAYYDTNIDSSIYFTKQSGDLAKRIKYLAGEREAELSLASAYALKGSDSEAKARFHRVRELLAVSPSTEVLANYNYSLGTFYLRREQRDSAIIYFKKALPAAQQLGEERSELLFLILNNLALVYQRSADFQQALFYYQRALKLEQIQYNPFMQAGIYLNMGLVHIAINDTVRAERTMFRALRLVKNRGDHLELDTYVTLTALYDFKQDQARVYQYAMKAASMCRQFGDLSLLAVVWSRAAWALSYQKKYPKAEALNRQAIGLADSLRQANTNINYEVYANMGSILTVQGKYSRALPFFEQALRQLGSTQLFDRKIRRFYTHLALCYEKTGNYAKALTAFQTATMINDSARNRENIRKTVEQHLNFEFAKNRRLPA